MSDPGAKKPEKLADEIARDLEELERIRLSAARSYRRGMATALIATLWISIGIVAVFFTGSLKGGTHEIVAVVTSAVGTLFAVIAVPVFRVIFAEIVRRPTKETIVERPKGVAGPVSIRVVGEEDPTHVDVPPTPRSPTDG